MTDHVVVVGAGVTGLAAGHELAGASPAVRFELLESDQRVGGMVGGGPVGPVVVDSGADGFLARQTEMTDLCRELDLGDDLVSPRTSRAYIWAGGDLRPIPTPSVLGVPLDAETLARSHIVSPTGLTQHRASVARPHPPLVADATIGDVLRPRIGDEVFEYLVDPLLGGINAGSADEISIEASAAALADGAREGGSLPAALSSRSVPSEGPVFHGIRGGAMRIVSTLAESLGTRIATECSVRALERRGAGWEVTTSTGRTRRADAVLLTTPAPVTAALIRPFAPAAAAELAAVELADVVLVTFVYPQHAVGREMDGSGFLVPRREGLLMTACSWSSAKWEHYDDGDHAVMRVSAGRTDDGRWTDLDEETLITRLRAELATTMAVEGTPVAVRVSRHASSLPQYRPGHLERMDSVADALAGAMPGVFATGAAFRGLGLPACVRQGRDAARAALAHLELHR